MNQIKNRNFIEKDPKYISLGIVELVTLFEKIEQLDKEELDFFEFCRSRLKKSERF